MPSFIQDIRSLPRLPFPKPVIAAAATLGVAAGTVGALKFDVPDHVGLHPSGVTMWSAAGLVVGGLLSPTVLGAVGAAPRSVGLGAALLGASATFGFTAGAAVSGVSAWRAANHAADRQREADAAELSKRLDAAVAPAAGSPVPAESFQSLEALSWQTTNSQGDPMTATVKTDVVVGSATGYETEAGAWEAAKLLTAERRQGVFVVKGPETYFVVAEAANGTGDHYEYRDWSSRLKWVGESPATDSIIAGYMAWNGISYEVDDANVYRARTTG